MKHLVLVGDGMADFAIPELGGQTPLEAAFTPSMDEVATTGASGLFCPIPDGLPPGSAVGNLSLFGYSPHQTFSGRAPFEAANQGIRLSQNQIAFRCNLVTLEDGVMKDFTAGHISNEEAHELISTLNAELSHFQLSFSPGVGYRHITVLSGSEESLDQYQQMKCTPPHDITGKPFAEHLPEGEGSAFIREVMEASQSVLSGHPVNEARRSRGESPATSIWLWGQGRTPSMVRYGDRFGIRGAVISAVDLIKGIGMCAGLEVVHVPGATGYLDTNYEGKVRSAIEAIRLWDYAYLHVEAPDEASHQGRLDLKIRAIEDFDARVVAPCLDFISKHKDCRLVVATDHVTALSTLTHERGPVPFGVCGSAVKPNGAKAFHEKEAQATGILVENGYHLLPYIIQASEVDVSTLNPAPK